MLFEAAVATKISTLAGYIIIAIVGVVKYC
jgi:hypothetical protein